MGSHAKRAEPSTRDRPSGSIEPQAVSGFITGAEQTRGYVSLQRNLENEFVSCTTISAQKPRKTARRKKSSAVLRPISDPEAFKFSSSHPNRFFDNSKITISRKVKKTLKTLKPGQSFSRGYNGAGEDSVDYQKAYKTFMKPLERSKVEKGRNADFYNFERSPTSVGSQMIPASLNRSTMPKNVIREYKRPSLGVKRAFIDLTSGQPSSTVSGVKMQERASLGVAVGARNPDGLFKVVLGRKRSFGGSRRNFGSRAKIEFSGLNHHPRQLTGSKERSFDSSTRNLSKSRPNFVSGKLKSQKNLQPNFGGFKSVVDLHKPEFGMTHSNMSFGRKTDGTLAPIHAKNAQNPKNQKQEKKAKNGISEGIKELSELRSCLDANREKDKRRKLLNRLKFPRGSGATRDTNQSIKTPLNVSQVQRRLRGSSFRTSHPPQQPGRLRSVENGLQNQGHSKSQISGLKAKASLNNLQSHPNQPQKMSSGAINPRNVIFHPKNQNCENSKNGQNGTNMTSSHITAAQNGYMSQSRVSAGSIDPQNRQKLSQTPFRPKSKNNTFGRSSSVHSVNMISTSSIAAANLLAPPPMMAKSSINGQNSQNQSKLNSGLQNLPQDSVLNERVESSEWTALTQSNPLLQSQKSQILAQNQKNEFFENFKTQRNLKKKKRVSAHKTAKIHKTTSSGRLMSKISKRFVEKTKNDEKIKKLKNEIFWLKNSIRDIDGEISKLKISPIRRPLRFKLGKSDERSQKSISDQEPEKAPKIAKNGGLCSPQCLKRKGSVADTRRTSPTPKKTLRKDRSLNFPKSKKQPKTGLKTELDDDWQRNKTVLDMESKILDSKINKMTRKHLLLLQERNHLKDQLQRAYLTKHRSKGSRAADGELEVVDELIDCQNLLKKNRKLKKTVRNLKKSEFRRLEGKGAKLRDLSLKGIEVELDFLRLRYENKAELVKSDLGVFVRDMELASSRLRMGASLLPFVD